MTALRQYEATVMQFDHEKETLLFIEVLQQQTNLLEGN
jgi:hypothetical protein